MKKLALIGLLLPFLMAAEPAGTPISMNGTPRSLTDWASELSRQANIRIEVDQANATPVAYPCKATPFWEVLESIAMKSQQRLTVAPKGPRVTLGGGPYRSIPLAVRGPFRIVARRVLTQIDLESGQSMTDIHLEVVWEPSFKAFYAEVVGHSIQALDEQGKPLAVTENGGGKMEVDDFGQEIVVRLPNIPKNVQKMASLQGRISFIGTMQMLQFRFDPSVVPAKQDQDGIQATLFKFKKTGRIWIAGFELQYPKGGPEFESYQSYLRDNQVWLTRADGTKFPCGDFELGAEHQRKTIVNYRFLENEKDGLAITHPADWKLSLRTPGKLVEVAVDFELKNIPLK